MDLKSHCFVIVNMHTTFDTIRSKGFQSVDLAVFDNWSQKWMNLKFFSADKSILDSPLPKQNNEDVQQRTVPASSPTSATERAERASHTPTQDNTPTVTTTSPGEATAESTSTTSQVTYSTTTQTTPSTTTQTTPQTTVQAIPLSTGAFGESKFNIVCCNM